MAYHMKIKTLEIGVKDLAQRIQLTEDEQTRSELIKKKAVYEDELRKITKLQWEEDHERVNLDDNY